MGFFQRFWSIFAEFFGRHPAPIVSLPPSLTFAGQTILVTGATSGLGLEAAVIFTQLGAENVIITARTLSKGQIAKAEIEERTGKQDVISVRLLDMDSFEDVKTFMVKLKEEVKRIDAVLLNAGVHRFQYELLPTGWEDDIQVNVLSTSLLGLLMVQWMREISKEGQEQHLVVVNSGSHMDVDIEGKGWPKKDVLSFWSKKENFLSGRNNYGVSKLLQMYACREIAAISLDPKNGKPNPIFNTVCPGMIKTEIARDFKNSGFIYKMIEKVFMAIQAHPVGLGGISLVLAITTTEGEHGMFRRPYLTDLEYTEREKKNLTSIEGEKMQARVWKELISVLKEVEPEVEKIARL